MSGIILLFLLKGLIFVAILLLLSYGVEIATFNNFT
jgi:hypothetical protein